jgi:hypothetical protein
LKSEGNTWGVEVEMRGMDVKEKEKKNKEEFIKK